VNYLSTVEPHALQLEAIASAMEADGIGGDLSSGHAVVLRKMAGDMRADAARGRISGTFNAAAQPSCGLSGALSACKAAGVVVPATKTFSSVYELDQALTAAFKNKPPHLVLDARMQLKNKIFAAGMVAEDSRPINEKQVIGTARMLKKFGIPMPTQVHSLASINAELDARPEISAEDRVAVKQNMIKAGLLDAGDGDVVPPAPRPNIRMAHSIFDQLGLERPAGKASLGLLNAAMDRMAIPTERRIAIKTSLSAAGFLD
jgi:hypothetical protein